MQIKCWRIPMRDKWEKKSINNHTIVFSCFCLLNFDYAGRTFFGTFSASNAFLHIHLCCDSPNDLNCSPRTDFYTTATSYAIGLFDEGFFLFTNCNHNEFSSKWLIFLSYHTSEGGVFLWWNHQIENLDLKLSKSRGLCYTFVIRGAVNGSKR